MTIFALAISRRGFIIKKKVCVAVRRSSLATNFGQCGGGGGGGKATLLSNFLN